MNKKVLKRIEKLNIKRISTFFEEGFNLSRIEKKVKIKNEKELILFEDEDDILLCIEYEKIKKIRRVKRKKLLIVYTDTTEFHIKLI